MGTMKSIVIKYNKQSWLCCQPSLGKILSEKKKIGTCQRKNKNASRPTTTARV